MIRIDPATCTHKWRGLHIPDELCAPQEREEVAWLCAKCHERARGDIPAWSLPELGPVPDNLTPEAVGRLSP